MCAVALLVGAVIGSNAIAGDTLRVGSNVLVVGDTATQVIELLGTPRLKVPVLLDKPVYKVPVDNRYGAYSGEQWQYLRTDGHVLVITLISGRVTDIDDRTGSR